MTICDPSRPIRASCGPLRVGCVLHGLHRRRQPAMVMAISHVEQKNRNGFSTFCRAFISFLVYHFDIYHFDVYHFLDTFALCFQSVAQERGFPDQLITDKGDENRLLAFSCHAVQDNMPYAVSDFLNIKFWWPPSFFLWMNHK